MRSISSRHPRQAGQSLVEALVASALLAVAVGAGLQALAAVNLAAKEGIRQSWAQCVVRMELELTVSSAWSDSGYYSIDPNVSVVASIVSSAQPPAPGALQLITITARDPETHAQLFQASAYKVHALYAATDPSAATLAANDSAIGSPSSGCPAP